ncbi:MAG: Oxidoreductase, partial [Candidatus Saccharibacteria bacterium]|nr:Oxidoreductase [Candidatus Saccharibacteria bacterium]
DTTQPEPGLDAKLEPPADHGEESYEGTGRLKGRKALITGGDSGIGRAIAIAFAREGADVAISYLPAEEVDAKETIGHIQAAGRKALGIPGDITSEGFCGDLVEEVADAFGSIDILVNNAGKQVYVEKLEDIPSEQFQKTFATNVFAMFWITKAAVPYMPKGAAIINTTSIQSYEPSPGLLDYASTKGAITAFTHSLAKMLIDKGIRVNAVAPGPIWTPLQPSYGQPPEKLEKFGTQTPMGRAGQPAEVAPAFVFLASQESSYITGEVIGVTGGQHTQ